MFAYFIGIIFIGSGLLSIPGAWDGDVPLSYLDALFTATSAVCVTGLITVDTASFTLFGQAVIMGLIQAGGLGILTFTTLFLLFPGNRISFRNRKLIRDYYLESVEAEPQAIIRTILLVTFGLEIVGALILYSQFDGVENRLFSAFFHAVSAFSNAGFSTFSTSLEGYARESVVLVTIAGLVIFGGLSFVVIHEVWDWAFRKRRRLSLHSKIVLLMTGGFLIAGTLAFYLMEGSRLIRQGGAGFAVANSFFLSVMPRTAGFNAIPVAGLSMESQIITVLFMFVGGAPGSIAGGVKVTTFFLILLIVFRGVDDRGQIRVGKRRLSAKSLSHANMFMLKAFFLLVAAIFSLSIFESELIAQGGTSFLEILFEAVSAFGTVGLSHGLTPYLSSGGKVVIILTMFAGRVGLVTMALRNPRRHVEHLVDYPKGEVLIG